MTTVTETNAYWDAVRNHIEDDPFGGGPTVDEYGSLARRRGGGDFEHRADRRELTSAYSWTVTAPATVAFVVEHAGLTVVDPLAGSGWWAYLLDDAGITVFASDVNPPDGTEANIWHRGSAYMPVARADAADAVGLAPANATLLLSWPPYDNDCGFRALSAYHGNRVVYIGEGWGGCCGDDAMFELLNTEWTNVAEHRPVQFYGLHDYVTIYDRKEDR